MSRLICKTLFVCTAGLLLASCGTTGKHKSHKPQTTARKVQPVRISHIDRTQGSQELMLHSMGLIGTPYKWGGSTTATGFDCSGMIQFVYKNALNVNLPRTARDMAAASRKISDDKLKAGDLVFFQYRRRTQIFPCRPLHRQRRIHPRPQQRQNHQNRKTFHPVLRQKLFGRTYFFY